MKTVVALDSLKPDTPFGRVTCKMDKFQRSFYELHFELAFMKKKGKEFQDHFSEIMEKGHPGDFQRIKPWGNVGDQKCDGYLKSMKQMFAVYAPNEVEEAQTLKKIPI